MTLEMFMNNVDDNDNINIKKMCTNGYEYYGYKCPNKGNLLSLNMFWKDRRRPDGRSAMCISCSKWKNKNGQRVKKIKNSIPSDMSVCMTCLQLLPLDKFWKSRGQAGKGISSRCIECLIAQRKQAWNALSPEEQEIVKAKESQHKKQKLIDMKENDPEAYQLHCQKSREKGEEYRANPANWAKIKERRKRAYWEGPVTMPDAPTGKEHDRIYREQYFNDPEKGEARRTQSKKNNREWSKANPEKKEAMVARRRVRRKGNKIPDTWEPLDGEVVLEIYKLKNKMNKAAGCQRFNEPHPENRCWGACVKYHVDHIIPIAKGGPHHQDNLRITEASMNKSKSWNLDEEIKDIPYDFYRKGCYTIDIEGKRRMKHE
jgi:hypothetical protein